MIIWFDYKDTWLQTLFRCGAPLRPLLLEEAPIVNPICSGGFKVTFTGRNIYKTIEEQNNAQVKGMTNELSIILAIS